MTTRQLALSNSTSTYYQNVNSFIRRAMVDNETANTSRKRVMLPFLVESVSLAEYERKFGWHITVENHGLRSSHTPHVAGLAYCMALRNMLLMGRDGEEVIAIDADLPMIVAKGMAYVKIVRTYSSNRLTAGYTLEEMQLQRLRNSHNSAVRGAAGAVLEELKQGGGSRVFLDAKHSSIIGDTVLLDHTRTSMSLQQAVACATAWQATAVRGVCFFQMEMLVHNTGQLSAFPGEYIIDTTDDIITYIPKSDPEACFTHSWSALKSFFLNHQCVYAGKTWLVEKHLGDHGMFHYIATKAQEDWLFPSELGANYYSADLTEWVELEFPTRGGVADGATGVYWRRETVRLLKALYDKTISVMLSVETKRLTREEVLAVMRAYNNTMVCGGDTVKRPVRVYAGDLDKAATPILAQVVHRRAKASAECSNALSVIRRRYSIANESVFSLFWEVLVASSEYATDVSVPVVFGSQSGELEKLVDGTVNLAVIAKDVPKCITVTQIVGNGLEKPCGDMMPGMPGDKPSFVSELLSRARRFALEGSAMFKYSSLPSSTTDSSDMSSGGVELVVKDNNTRDSGISFGLVEDQPAIVEEETFHRFEPAERAGVAAKLYEKLVAAQDAADYVRPPKLVHRYALTKERPIGQIPTILHGVAGMQEDYDDGFPGVSTYDAEIVAHVASTEDTSIVRDAHMSINNAKREIAQPQYVRRSVCRGGAAGVLPRTQLGLLAATGKRNNDVPMNRELVDFEFEPAEAVKAIQTVCYKDDWKETLQRALDSGLWCPNTDDINIYIDKVDTAKAEAIVNEYLSVADADMLKWWVMTKDKAKPPLDPGADSKVPLPQTIMYNESKNMNAQYSAEMSRFHDVVDEMMLPNIKFNDRSSPAEHEIWFNTLQPLRATAKTVYRYQGDSYNFDRSQELMAFTTELLFYRNHGLDESTLNKWKQTMGVKTAISVMHGFLMHIVMQGLSGIFKTLFRNGLVTLASVVVSASLKRETLISLDIKGDDYTIETTMPIDVERATRLLAWKFNFSAKLWGCDDLYFCSKYWIHFDDWWYWVADPERKFESLAAAVKVDNKGETTLSEKHISLRDDLRHYDNGGVMELLGEAVMRANPRRSYPPMMLIGGLANLAEDRDAFFAFYKPVELVGL